MSLTQAERSNVTPISQPEPEATLRASSAEAIDLAAKMLHIAARDYQTRSPKVAMRLAICRMAVLASTNDAEWEEAARLFISDQSLVLLNACKAAFAAIVELLLLSQPNGEDRAKGNADLNCLRDAIRKAGGAR